MLFDMGFNITPNMSDQDIKEKVNAVDEMFDFIIISEKIDESLILMKELLCWDFEDIVLLVKNARKDYAKFPMTDTIRQKLLALNKADVILYDHFLKKHENAVSLYGVDKMADQIKKLQKLRDETFSRCNITTTASFKVKSSSAFFNRVNAYKTTKNTDRDCRLLMTQELDLVSEIRMQQISSLAAKSKLLKS